MSMRQGLRLIAIIPAVLLAVLVSFVSPTISNAATFEQINDDDVWEAHEGDESGYCVLVANSMMLRRASMLNGDANWNTITYHAVQPIACVDGSSGGYAVKWTYSYAGMSVAHGTLPKDQGEKEQELIRLLAAHPEGIALYANSSVPHCVLLTDYTDGTFYCVETMPWYTWGRMEIERSPLVTLENCSSYWCVTSRVSGLEPMVRLQSLSINRTSVTLYEGESVELEVSANPSNGKCGGIDWSDDGQWVVSISPRGRRATVYAGYVYDGRQHTTVVTASATKGGAPATCTITVKPTPAGAQPMYRLYNPNSGEHFYTANEGERNTLIAVGWNYEGIGWFAPSKSGTPVYRLYNPIAGEHHYTTSKGERDALVRAGWNDEGVGWYSDDARGMPLYRQYNPNQYACNHNYTTNKGENDTLVGLGWQAEGIGWYGVKG